MLGAMRDSKEDTHFVVWEFLFLTYANTELPLWYRVLLPMQEMWV